MSKNKIKNFQSKSPSPSPRGSQGRHQHSIGHGHLMHGGTRVVVVAHVSAVVLQNSYHVVKSRQDGGDGVGRHLGVAGKNVTAHILES